VVGLNVGFDFFGAGKSGGGGANLCGGRKEGGDGDSGAELEGESMNE
jgi:hypothetical protein